MATNPPKGDGHRNGAVRDRSQVHNPQNDRWVKRDTEALKEFVGQDKIPYFSGSFAARSLFCEKSLVRS